MEHDHIAPNWTIRADRLSVTVGINTRLWLCRKQGLKPALIRLGREHTRLFLREHGLHFIPNKKPRRLVSGHLFWDESNCRLCYSEQMIPVRFNDPKIIGIAVEGERPSHDPRCQAVKGQAGTRHVPPDISPDTASNPLRP